VRGELIGVWSETWREIWSKLGKHPAAPSDLFAELYRELVRALEYEPDAQLLADIVDDPKQAQTVFQRTRARALRSENAVITFFEEAHGVLTDLGGDSLANRYFALVESFIAKYSLRYDLR
jgi:hypothetical protein